MRIECFSYSWVFDEKTNIIRCYALTEDDKSVCVNIEGFCPYLYIQVPEEFENYIDDVCSAIATASRIRPAEITLERKKQLYFANVCGGQTELFPFLKYQFKSRKLMNIFKYKLGIGKTSNSFNVSIHGADVELKIYEDNAEPILQFISNYDLPAAGWMSINGYDRTNDDRRVSTCRVELFVPQSLISGMNKIEKPVLPRPTVISFDIECYSSCPGAMPNSSTAADKCFQIAIVIGKDCNDAKRILFSLVDDEKTEINLDGGKVYCFTSEAILLREFASFIYNSDAQVIIGYNTAGFDIPYLIERAKHNSIFPEFCSQQYVNGPAKIDRCKWSSSAFGNNEFEYINAEGRLFIDLLPLIKRDYKLNNYKLNTVAQYFVGAAKDPLKPKDIFAAYERGVLNHSPPALEQVGKYCVQDSFLVMQLYEKLMVWAGICEMGNTTNVPLHYLYTRGQQIKVFSLIYKYCTENNYVVQRNMFEPEGTYKGATVFNPTPGMYDNVITLDFASLYPSIIIAYNIDYSTLIREEDYDKFTTDDYHLFKWEEHEGCIHDEETKKPKRVICKSYEYRFVKSPRGVLPAIEEHLLSARKQTRNIMKTATGDYKIILDKRQNAFKVCANSAYGILGVQNNGMLALMPAAMCITFQGRQMVQFAAETLEKTFGGDVIYGDTDSNFCRFPQCKSIEELWDYSLHVEKEINKLFPPPIRMEFTPKICKRMLLMKKKRYIATMCGKDGIVTGDMYNKGSLIVRRDSCLFIKNIYSKVLEFVFDYKTKREIIDLLEDYINAMFYRQYSYRLFVNTKSLKSDEEYKYIPLPRNQQEKEEILNKMRLTEQDYYKKLPAHVFLARKIRARGGIAAAGTRIEYIILTIAPPDAIQCEKIEDVDYYRRHRDILRLDYIFYLKLLVQPIDDLLNIVFGKCDVMKQLYRRRLKKYKLCKEIEYVFSPTILFE